MLCDTAGGTLRCSRSSGTAARSSKSSSALPDAYHALQLPGSADLGTKAWLDAAIKGWETRTVTQPFGHFHFSFTKSHGGWLVSAENATLNTRSWLRPASSELDEQMTSIRPC